MATDDTVIPKDPPSEKLKQFSKIVMATDHVRISIAMSVEGQSDSSTHTQPQVIATDDTCFPKDPSSEKLKQSSHKAMATDHVRSSTVVPVDGQSDSSTHIQSQERLVKDLIQISSKASSNQNSWKISKVPPRLRYVNWEAYEPRAISIGPYNYGKKHLKVMEIIKERSLSRILEEGKVTANEFVTAMQGMEKDVRKRYSEKLDHIDRDTFVKMMIIDGCFIVDLFQNNHQRKEFWEQVGIRKDIYCDLLLLENQLPFSVLSKLYGIIKESDDETDEFAHLALSSLEEFVLGQVKFRQKVSENNKDVLDIKHLLGLVHDCWICPLKRVEGQGTLRSFIPCARELKDSGIKFVKKDNDDDIEFTDDATLKIPTIKIDNKTEIIFRNIMAFEQSIPIWEPMYVCDYVEFMDNLIDSDKDVQLLSHSGVLVNSLSDDEAVARMFNRLRDSTYTSEFSFCYKKIYDEVNKHCQKKLSKLRANFLKTVRFLINWRRASDVICFCR